MAAPEDPPTLAARGRLVGRSFVAGAAVGAAGTVALALLVDVEVAAERGFAVGALLLGFGLLGWSGSILAGDGYETMQDHLDVSTGWTERKSRRAMARIGGFGAGWMVGASVVTVVVA